MAGGRAGKEEESVLGRMKGTGNLGVFTSFQFPVHFHSHRFPRSQMSLEMKQ